MNKHLFINVVKYFTLIILMSFNFYFISNLLPESLHAITYCTLALLLGCFLGYYHDNRIRKESYLCKKNVFTELQLSTIWHKQ